MEISLFRKEYERFAVQPLSCLGAKERFSFRFYYLYSERGSLPGPVFYEKHFLMPRDGEPEIRRGTTGQSLSICAVTLKNTPESGDLPGYLRPIFVFRVTVQKPQQSPDLAWCGFGRSFLIFGTVGVVLCGLSCRYLRLSNACHRGHQCLYIPTRVSCGYLHSPLSTLISGSPAPAGCRGWRGWQR